MSQSLTEHVRSVCTDDVAGVQYLQTALFNSFRVFWSTAYTNVLIYKNRIYVQDIFYWDKKEHDIKTILLLSDLYLNKKKKMSKIFLTNRNQLDWKRT